MFEMENNKAIKPTISSTIRIRSISSISRFSRRFFGPFPLCQYPLPLQTHKNLRDRRLKSHPIFICSPHSLFFFYFFFLSSHLLFRLLRSSKSKLDMRRGIRFGGKRVEFLPIKWFRFTLVHPSNSLPIVIE